MMTRRAEGPYFDELSVGQVFDAAPPVRLGEGRAAVHDAIVGNRLRLVLDPELCAAVTGGAELVSPALVWNLSIGQSTVATHHVKANLFYRRLALLRQPVVGDVLRTETSVVGLRENQRKEGRAPTGLAALHIRTVDQRERPVLDFYRCAMLPLRGDAATGHEDDLARIGVGVPDLDALVPAWDASRWRKVVGAAGLAAGDEVTVIGGDVVSSAPELARLTLNVAAVHHDARVAGGGRLVYGGHTIAIALAQLNRAFPTVATVLAWASCDHVGPVREGDTLRSVVEVERVVPHATGWSVAELRSRVYADDGDQPQREGRLVLDWRLTVLC